MFARLLSPLAGLKKLFSKISDSLSTNNTQGRNIFSYWDGTKTLFADPAILLRDTKNHPTFRFEAEIAPIDFGDIDAKERTANAACDVFDVKRFNGETGEGLTVHELIALWVQFYSWMGALKKNINGQATSLQPMDSESLASSETSTTKPDSVSRSTPSGAI